MTWASGYAAQLAALHDVPLVRTLLMNRECRTVQWAGQEEFHYHRVVQRLLDIRALEHDFSDDPDGNVLKITEYGKGRLEWLIQRDQK